MKLGQASHTSLPTAIEQATERRGRCREALGAELRLASTVPLEILLASRRVRNRRKQRQGEDVI
jgi:hypothetical protein